MGALGLVLMAILLPVFLWWLYRLEGRGLSVGKRIGLVAIRMITLAALAVMVVEPVLISTRRETVKSHLPIVLDDSESMRFSDPYTDDSKAAEIATALKLRSEGKQSPIDRLRETPRLDLVKNALKPNMEALAKGRELFLYDLESAAQNGPDASARARKLDDIKPKRAVSPLGDALQGVMASHRGQPLAGVVLVTDGRSNAGEDPLRAAETAIRQNVPLYLIAAGCRGRAAKRSTRRDRGQPGRLRARSDDDRGRRRSTRTQGCRGDTRPRTARQRERMGADCQRARRFSGRTGS